MEDLFSVIGCRKITFQGIIGEWEEWRPVPEFNYEPCPDSLLRYMRENEMEHGWERDKLAQSGDEDPRIWHYGNEVDFRIPMVMFRTVSLTGNLGKWHVFNAPVLPLAHHSPEGLVEWMKESHKYGWYESEFHKEDCDDPHAYYYGRTHRFWVPILTHAQRKTIPAKFFGLAAACVNPLGCEFLMAGKEYVFRTEVEDGLVTVRDDSGTKREYLAERFGTPHRCLKDPTA